MPSFEQYLMKGLLLNCVPLFEMIVLGIPNLVIILFQTNLIKSLSLMLANGLASTHFVK